MIGVNIYSIDKYIQILLNTNYTIMLISQTSEPPYVKREVTNVIVLGQILNILQRVILII